MNLKGGAVVDFITIFIKIYPMRIDKVCSLRRVNSSPGMQIIYEWEDAFAEALGVKVKADPKWLHCIKRALRPFFPGESVRGRNFYIEPQARIRGRRDYGKGTILYIIRYNLPDSDFEAFMRYVDDASLVFVASKQVHEYLLAKGASPQRFHHLAISIPDKYIAENESGSTEQREYDVTLVGRASKLYDDYIDCYSQRHPDARLLRRRRRHGKMYFYTTKGELAAKTHSRKAYIDLLKHSKVALYCAPGTAEDDLPTDSLTFSEVTPKLLEAMACGCSIVPRYLDNADSRYFELHRFGPSVRNYDMFEKEVDAALGASLADHGFYQQYLRKHSTSKRGETLKEVLRKR